MNRYRSYAIILLLLAAAWLGAPDNPALGADVYDQERCSLCHIRQSVFFDARFVPPGRQKEWGEERVCSSCHNGVVSDSRTQLWRGAQHPPVGGGGDKGEVRRCSRCHSPHTKNGGWGVLAGTSVSIRRGSDAQCAGCHQGYSSRQTALHAKSFPDGGCKECHRAHGGVGRTLLRENRETLCVRCHAMRETGAHPTAASSSESGAGRPFPECISCHPVHPKSTAAQRNGAALCAGCHPALKEVEGKPHHPGVGDCLSCHVFHRRTGEGGRALRGREIRPELLCVRCHASYRADTSKQARETGMHVTKVGAQQDLCFRCHAIHKSAAGTPLLISAKAYSCFECHEQQNSISEIKGIVLAHPVFERIEKKRSEALADKGKKAILGPKGEIVCRTCHRVHKASPGTALVVGASGESGICYKCHENKVGKEHVPKKAGKEGKEFGCVICHPVHGRTTLSADDPWKNLCADCHPRVSMHPQGEADRSTRRPPELPAFDPRGRTVRIGTISCPTCHEPHESKAGRRRLRKDYRPSGFLCTSCHPDRERLALTPHDLRGIAGEGFCEPCHVPHGGTAPWMLGITPDPSAGDLDEGVCRSCHKEKGIAAPLSKSGHPVNMVVGRPLPDVYPLSTSKGGRVAGLLVCSSCHDVHGTGYVPVGMGAGNLLRRPADQTEGVLTRNGECLPCHGNMATHAKTDCIACHPPHKEMKPDAGCTGCHEGREKGIAAVHVANGKGCIGCHRVHPKGGEGRKPSGEAKEAACIACHPKTDKIIGTVHATLDGGACGACHPVHEDLPKVTVKRKAYEETFAANLPCLRCHQEGGMAPLPELSVHPTRKKNVPTNYGGTVTLESAVTMVGRYQERGKSLFPLFDETGKAGLSGQVGCLTCHDPHAGQSPAGGKGDNVPAGYLRDSSDTFIGEICSACHRGDAAVHVRKFHTLPRKEVD